MKTTMQHQSKMFEMHYLHVRTCSCMLLHVRNMLLPNHPQGSKSFERWPQEVSNAAKLINYNNYDWKQAAVDAMILQTSYPKLWERALQENVTYEKLVELGITKEQSEKGAHMLEQASGQSNSSNAKIEDEVRKLQLENQKMKARLSGQSPQSACWNCGRIDCESKCLANGQQCSKWGSKSGATKKKTVQSGCSRIRKLSDDSDSDELIG